MLTTADRVLAVLRLFTISRPAWTVEQAAAALGLAISTAYRYFHSLVEADLLVNFSAGHYVLGPAIIEFDRQTRHRDPLIQAAAAAMEHLGQVSADATVLLCRVYRLKVMCVDQRQTGASAFALKYERGRPMPLFCGAPSKIILANLPTRTLRRVYPQEAEAVRDSGLGASWQEVKARLRAIRNTGVAVTRGEVDAAMVGIAAPVFDGGHDILGSISLMLAEPVAAAEVERLVVQVRAAAARATRNFARPPCSRQIQEGKDFFL